MGFIGSLKCTPRENRRTAMVRLVIATALVLLLIGPMGMADDRAGQPKVGMVRLRIDGLRTADDAKRVMDALVNVPNIKVATRPTVDQPVALVGSLRGATWDVGDLARVVAQTKTSSR